MYEWQNLDLELFDHDTVGSAESVKVRIARSPAGVQREPQSVGIPSALREGAEALANDGLDLEQTIALGQQLAAILFPGPAARMFADSRARLSADTGLRIRIELRSLGLADLPWEFVYWRPDNPDDTEPQRGFLALNRSLSLVRYEPVPEPPGEFTPLGNAPLEVALLLANPEIPGWARLDLDAEVRAVESALRDEPAVEFGVFRNATTRSLHDALDARPHVFQFSGHGRFRMVPSEEYGGYVGQGELLFENAAGGIEAVSARELAGKMRGCGVRLAVLNSCDSARRDNINAFTGIAPTLVRDGVPAVVAMQYPIRDAHALRLARRLYHNLVNHESIDAAVTSARLAMFDLNTGFDRDWGVPVLYLQSDKAILFPEESAEAVPARRRLGRFAVVNLVLVAVLVFALAYLYLRHVEPRLPFGTIVGGVLLAALVAAVAIVRFFAADRVRDILLDRLRRRRATAVLVGALAVAGLAIAFTPPPLALRVVAGKDLLSLIAPQTVENPIRRYELVVTAAGHDPVRVDFRQHGVVLADSAGLAARLGGRYGEQVKSGMGDYLLRHQLGIVREKYMGKWRLAGTPHRLRGLGKAGSIEVRLEQSGDVVSCHTVRPATLHEAMTVLFLEKGNACE